MLARFRKNPILKPSENWWESKAVYNAGATRFEGKILLLYRAQGNDWISRFGLAESEDGFHFKRISDLPVLEPEPHDQYERLGIEDPRIIKIEDSYLITYTAASVYPATFAQKLIPNKSLFRTGVPWRIRIGLAQTKEFRNFEKLGILFPELDTKNAILFPEKIEGQFVLIFRILPNMVVSFSKNLANWTSAEFLLSPRYGHWDSEKIGAGAPPLKTKKGWLLFYHGVDKDRVYHLGALLLDLNNPKIILARSKKPLLSPEKPYEKKGLVPNVVFTCGAIEEEGKYIVYYGAADKVICAATIDKDLEKIF